MLCHSALLILKKYALFYVDHFNEDMWIGLKGEAHCCDEECNGVGLTWTNRVEFVFDRSYMEEVKFDGEGCARLKKNDGRIDGENDCGSEKEMFLCMHDCDDTATCEEALDEDEDREVISETEGHRRWVYIFGLCCSLVIKAICFQNTMGKPRLKVEEN